MPPVRVRIYGLSLTKRGYVLWLIAGAAMLVGLLSLWLALFAGAEPSPAEAAGASPGHLAWGFLRRWMPLLLIGAGALEGVEAYFVLRRFRRAEAERAAGASHESPVKET